MLAENVNSVKPALNPVSLSSLSHASFYPLFSGYMCEEHNNPADFFLDVISGEAVKVGQISTLHKESETDGEC